MKFKRILAGILAAAITVTSVSLPSFAVSPNVQQVPETTVTADKETKKIELVGETYGDFSYSVLDDDTVEISRYYGSDETVEIPAEIDGKKVTSIGSYAFSDNSYIISVIIPDGLIDISYEAFRGCSSLKSVYIPDSVTYIGSDAFRYCTSLEEVNLPDGLLYLNDSLFSGCKSLKSITIPDTVKSIGTWVFNNCLSLTEINVGENNENYKSLDGVLFEKSGKTLLAFPAGKKGEYTIPDGVVKIYSAAFSDCSLVSISIPNSVEYIGNYAFSNCSLASIPIPNSVEYIGNHAFSNCSALTSVTIPDSVKYLGNSRYTNDEYGGGVFKCCTSLISVTLGEGIKEIDRSTFYGCTSLETVTIPNSVTMIMNEAFCNCTNLKSITIPDSVKNIGSDSFSFCSSLKSVILSKNISEIGYSSFSNCESLTSITLPESVKEIESYAFYDCINLSTINIPDSVCSIGKDAFLYTAALNSQEGDIKYLDKWLIKADENITSAEIKEETIGIAEFAFYNCNALESVTISDSVATIGEYAFCYCSSLTSVTIGNSVTSIGKEAFSDTKILNNITDEVKYIGNWLITADKNIETVEIKEGTIGVAGSAFAGGYIESVSFPNSIKYICSSAFSHCYDLKAVDIPYGITRLDYNVFCASGLKSIKLPESLKYIDSFALGRCRFTGIVIPNSVTEIEDYALLDNVSLEWIAIPESVTYIGNLAVGYGGGYRYDEEGNLVICKNDDLFIYCVKDTAAHRYATDNGFKYRFMDKNGFAYTEKEDGTVEISKYLGNASEIKVPAEIDGKAVTSIGECAFRNCTLLTTITIPDSVTKICSGAFSDCTSLKSVTIPKTVTSIEDEAFGYYYDNYNYYYVKVADFKIYCYKNTAGEQYAIDNEFDYELLDACTEHDFGEWETVTPATCTEDGLQERFCTICGARETDIIPATGHTWGKEWTIDVEPTCTEAGSKSHHCINCDAKTDITEIPATGHKFVDKVVEPTYTAKGYTLHTCSVCGYSYKDSETPKLVLAKITGFKASSRTDTTVTLKWNKNSEATGYIIEQYKNNKWVRIAKITNNATTTHKVTGLSASTRNAFRIQAYKEIGSGAVKSAYTDKLIVYTNPKAMSGFKASSKTDSVINLTWAKNTTATGYILEQYKGNKWVRIAKITNNATTTYKVSGLTASTRNAFRIQAYKEFGSGAVKSTYTDKLVVYTNPKAMTGFKASAKTKNTITLSWTKNTTATGYILQQYKGDKWVRIAKITNNATTTYKVSGLTANTRYAFRIQAYKECGSGAVKSAYTNKLVVYTTK